MNNHPLTLPAGSRAFVCGSTGSGKTTLALSMLSLCPPPVVILDTKYDPGIESWAKTHKIKITSKMPDWRSIENDLIVRPPADWIDQPEDLDWWCGLAFQCRFVPTLYIDEVYQVGRLGQGPGIIGLWTRGRAFGFRSIAGAQRPAWVSRFVISESDYHFVGHLRDARDRKAVAQSIGSPEIEQLLPKRKFFRGNADEGISVIGPIDKKTFDSVPRNVLKPVRRAKPAFK